MAATPGNANAGEVPTFKLVLVGDGGTGALFLFFSLLSSSSSRLLCATTMMIVNVLNAIESVVVACVCVSILSSV